MFRRAVLIVALMNLAYFVVEFVAAVSIRSVSLMADSADFFEDAAVTLLIFFAAAWTLKQRARVGTALTLTLVLRARFGRRHGPNGSMQERYPCQSLNENAFCGNR